MNRRESLELVFKLEYYFEDNLSDNVLGNLPKYLEVFKEEYLENSIRCSVYSSEDHQFFNKKEWINICNFEYDINSFEYLERCHLVGDIFVKTMENINLYDGFITTKDNILCGSWLYFVIEYKK